MIRIQDQKKELRNNKYVRHNKMAQKVKKIGGTAVGVCAVVGVGVAKYGKEAIKNAPQLAKAAGEVVKTIIKL